MKQIKTAQRDSIFTFHLDVEVGPCIVHGIEEQVRSCH